jgi:hypothetical protein
MNYLKNSLRGARGVYVGVWAAPNTPIYTSPPIMVDHFSEVI